MLYRRYVDETFAIFKEKFQAVPFQEYLNQQQSSIKFMMETAIIGKLSFSDLILIILNGKLQFFIFYKSTFSGLGTIFFCFFSVLVIFISTLTQ